MESLNGIGALFLLFLFFVTVSWAKEKLHQRADKDSALKAEK